MTWSPHFFFPSRYEFMRQLCGMTTFENWSFIQALESQRVTSEIGHRLNFLPPIPKSGVPLAAHYAPRAGCLVFATPPNK